MTPHTSAGHRDSTPMSRAARFTSGIYRFLPRSAVAVHDERAGSWSASHESVLSEEARGWPGRKDHIDHFDEGLGHVGGGRDGELVG